MDFTFLPHALEAMEERNIPKQMVENVLNNPDEIVPEKKKRNSYQSVVQIRGKPFMIRVIVDEKGRVITVYRTSKVSRYRSNPDE